MTDTEYPKIETLFERNKETFKVIEGYLRKPEFELIGDHWHLTEKVDGTNIRIEYVPSGLSADSYNPERPFSGMYVRGRTNNADIPTFLLESINKLVTFEKLDALFDKDAITTLYGEGYGAKIQKGGGNYRSDTSFRLFDVKVGRWWLNWANIEGIAKNLGIQTVPVVSPAYGVSWEHAVDILRDFHESTVALEDSQKEYVAPEGIVARTDPLLFDRKGDRLMWKLKHKDFAGDNGRADWVAMQKELNA